MRQLFQVVLVFQVALAAFAVFVVSQTGTAVTLEGAMDGSVEELEMRPGLVPLYLDHKKARVMLKLPGADGDGRHGRFILVSYLTGGLGSNPVGLDRSLVNESQIIHFVRAGERMLMVAENHDFRASSSNPNEQRAVLTSFPKSVLWSGKIEEDDETDGSVLIDFTSFLVSDQIGIATRLKSTGQGSFTLNKDRSYAHLDQANAFPLNLEFDATLTFTSNAPGPEIRTTTPKPEAVSLIAHTTLMALPDDGFQLRMYDERAGIFSASHIDMSAPLEGDVVRRLARRFRLEKDASGKIVKPIVFYVDNGAPEPIRSALVEGANWWADAFAAAGWPGGYRVEVLPEGVHPLDARYNVISWVHRATRGWSIGASVADPRTGEVLRGVVRLGSLRVRQDIKIFEALAGAGNTGKGTPDDPALVALARIRQLSAHEVGHALGFAHNMAASTYGNRASVMDYPAPDVRLEDGKLDFSHAYGVGMGIWDMFVVDFLYGDYGDMSDGGAQAAKLREADEKGFIYVSDADSRSVAAGHARGALWDNGSDPVKSLTEIMNVRAFALNRFGEQALRPGERAANLQTKFVPLYLYHRYQLEAAAKLVGGVDFAYRSKGDGRGYSEAIPYARQKAAVDAILRAVTSDALMIPDNVLATLSPIGDGEGDPQFSRESFSRSQRPIFNELGAVASAADVAFDALLAPARLRRIANQGVHEHNHKGLALITNAREVIFERDRSDTAVDLRIKDVVESRYAEHVMGLAFSGTAGIEVTAWAQSELRGLLKILNKRKGRFEAHASYLTRLISNAFERQSTPAVTKPTNVDIPPGSPIGSAQPCWHCY